MNDLKEFTTEQLEAEILRRKQAEASGYELEQCGGDYEKGEPSGRCDGMGLWICRDCRWRNPEGIKDENEQYMRRRHHFKKEVPRIKAKVRNTGKVIRVDDMPVDGYYNMWHNDENGTPWHDDELEFMEPRLQYVKKN